MLRAKDIEFRANDCNATSIVVHESLTDMVEPILEDTPLERVIVLDGDEADLDDDRWTTFQSVMDGQSAEYEGPDLFAEDPMSINYTTAWDDRPAETGPAQTPLAVLLQSDQRPVLVGRRRGYRPRGGTAVGNDWNWLGQVVLEPSWCRTDHWGDPAHLRRRFRGPRRSSRSSRTKVSPSSVRSRRSTGCSQTRTSIPTTSSFNDTLSAGEPLNREPIERIQDAWGVTPRDGYGQTETVALVTNYPGIDVKTGSMGKPTPGVGATIIEVDEDKEVEPGEIGEVAVPVDSPAIFDGYYEKPELDEQKLSGEYYRTGDLASQDEDGYFFFEGRADDIIISSGYRIGPFEVEDALVSHDAVAEAAAVDSPHDERGSVVKTYVILAEGLRGQRRPQDRTSGLHERGDGTLQIPPPDRVRRRTSKDLEWEDSTHRTARTGTAKHS